MELEIGKTYLTSHENDPYEVTIVAEYEDKMVGGFTDSTGYIHVGLWNKDGTGEYDKAWNLREIPEEPKKIEKIDTKNWTNRNLRDLIFAETLNEVIDKLNKLQS